MSGAGFLQHKRAAFGYLDCLACSADLIYVSSADCISTLGFRCAAALVDGDVTLATFDEKRLSDPGLLNLIDRTRIVEDPELNKGYPKGIPNDVTIACTDGSQVRRRVDFPRGHAENPMTDEEVVAKFRRLAEGVVSPQTAGNILDQVWNLDKMSDVTPLFAFEVREPS